jgi:hypothetical protein
MRLSKKKKEGLIQRRKPGVSREQVIGFLSILSWPSFPLIQINKQRR